MNEIAISVENLSKKYIIGHKKQTSLHEAASSFFANFGHTSEEKEEFWALKDISFEIKQGEAIGIIGKNGAGKSTLLKVLSRITEPTLGRFAINGHVASLLEVGTGFHPELTGRENIYLNGTILGMKREDIRKKFDEIVDFSGVERFIDTPVKRYSNGMYVRLAFSVAAFIEPEILLIDEVLSVGDAEFQKKCLGKMDDVKRIQGRALIFVSHNMTALKTLCSKGILINNGKLQYYGEMYNAQELYLSIYSKNSKRIFNKEGENEYIAIKRVEVLNSNNGFFHIYEPIAISIDLINKSIQDKLNVNIFVNTLEGTNLFASVSNITKIPLGPSNFTCYIPANFLNDISYSIDLMVVKNGEMPVISIKDIITIEGIEQKRNTAWLGKFPGQMRPNLEWIIK